MRIGWLKPLYGFTGRTLVCATRVARARLIEMGREIAGTETGVAIYIAEGARGFGDEAYRGRIIGAFVLAPMPGGKTVEDYPFADIDGRVRWPIGWPVAAERTVKLPRDRAPALKPLVVETCGAEVWRRLTPSFQGGAPSRLDGPLEPLGTAIASAFAEV
ncbi:MAG: hypothetical protein JO128_00435 [Alphaproteobacteria bacterium]|nr:hypothetical protein [Alphaproteobacteria bacterium]